jgi:hypothetical protein
MWAVEIVVIEEGNFARSLFPSCYIDPMDFLVVDGDDDSIFSFHSWMPNMVWFIGSSPFTKKFMSKIILFFCDQYM